MTDDLERLSVEELAAALDPGEDDAEMDDVDALILGELQRRLADETRRAEIPGTVLVQMAREVYKARAAKAARVVDEVEEPPQLAEIIANAGLPAARKRELVREEILRATGELDRLKEMLDGLEG